MKADITLFKEVDIKKDFTENTHSTIMDRIISLNRTYFESIFQAYKPFAK
jgi:hypothetical protein